MTISSYPYVKLLLAIIAAIVVGDLSNSWGWGIATFFILMFIFIWVASWIFGGPSKGKVEVNDELEELLNKLESIRNIKNALPFNARGWCNSLGLYVQLREMANMTRLQAGGELKSQIDAWQDYLESGTEWKVKKYNPGDWEKLVAPTLEIANWLSIYGGLPEEYAESFNRAIQAFNKEGHLELPDVKKAGGIHKARIARGMEKDKAEVLEEMCKLEDMFGMSFHGVAKGLTWAEANIIGRKVNPLFDGLINPRAFPVMEGANEAEIDKWLKDPRINCPLPDDFMMSIAARTPVPVGMIERILRTLLQEKYGAYWKMAEERVVSRKQD